MEKTERQKLVDQLSAHVLLSIFDETGESTEKLINRINLDPHVPIGLKKEVYDRCVVVLNKLMIEMAKQLPEGRPHKLKEGPKDDRSERVSGKP